MTSLILWTWFSYVSPFLGQTYLPLLPSPQLSSICKLTSLALELQPLKTVCVLYVHATFLRKSSIFPLLPLLTDIRMPSTYFQTHKPCLQDHHFWESCFIPLPCLSLPDAIYKPPGLVSDSGLGAIIAWSFKHLIHQPYLAFLRPHISWTGPE